MSALRTLYIRKTPGFKPGVLPLLRYKSLPLLQGQRQRPQFFSEPDGLVQTGGSPCGIHNRTRKKAAVNGQYHQNDNRSHDVYLPTLNIDIHHACHLNTIKYS